MLVIDPSWRKGNENEFAQGLMVWGEDGDPTCIQLEPGQQISWRVHGPRKCVGHRNQDGLIVKCPEERTLLGKKRRCEICTVMDTMNPCIRCRGLKCEATPERREQCRSASYSIYTAIFFGPTLKVGVSSFARTKTRWVEQGADFAAVLMETTDGKHARKIEDLLGRREGVTKSVRSTRKIQGVQHPPTREDAESLLTSRLNDTALEFDFGSISLTDLSKYYSLTNQVDSKPFVWKLREKIKDDPVILGEVVGMKGSLLVTRIDHSFSVVDLKQLSGYTLQSDENVHTVSQTGLLDFV